jgi:hypothetical protein
VDVYKVLRRCPVIGIGFINNINLIIYGLLAIENYRMLEKAYNTYIE